MTARRLALAFALTFALTFAAACGEPYDGSEDEQLECLSRLPETLDAEVFGTCSPETVDELSDADDGTRRVLAQCVCCEDACAWVFRAEMTCVGDVCQFRNASTHR